MKELNKHNKVAKEPLFHSNTASVMIQKSLFCLPTAAVWKSKEAFLIYNGVNSEAKPYENGKKNL